jgi:hypothetical protein
MMACVTANVLRSVRAALTVSSLVALATISLGRRRVYAVPRSLAAIAIGRRRVASAA